MGDEFVTFEIAKLAKEKGFDGIGTAFFKLDALRQDVNKPYSFMKPLVEDNLDVKRYYQDNFLLAPTQSLLQKWLREVNKIRVFVTKGSAGNYNFEIRKWNYDNNIGNWQRIGNISSLDTYEEALEKGLETALKLL